MATSPQKLRRIAKTAVSISALVLAACQPVEQTGGKSAVDEYRDASAQYARAVERLSKEAKPVTDRAALAKSLRLSSARLGTIKTGAALPGPLIVAFNPSADCKMGHCTCVGEEDCNQMFSGICNSPSTGGQCEGSGDATVCTCEYSAGDNDMETPTPTEPG